MILTRARTASLVIAVTIAALVVASLAPSTSAGANQKISGRPADGGGLLVSQTPDRASPLYLEGATVAADAMYVYYAAAADPHEDKGTRWVDFRLDGKRVKREWIAPFDLAGTAGDDRAMAFEVNQLSPGAHTLEARIHSWGKSKPVHTATFVVDGGASAETTTTTTTTTTTSTTTAPPEPVSGLMVSAAADRAEAWDLESSVLTGDSAYVFWAADGDTDVDHVEFELNGDYVRRENVAPYDLEGSADGVAYPLSLTDLGPGEHTVTATVTADDGTSGAVTASFAIPEQTTEAKEPSDSTSSRLSWSPPTLQNPTTIDVPTEPWTLVLDDGKDYRIRMPSSPVTKGMAIRGGRNVVLIGGEISIPWQGSDPSISQRRGLTLKNQTGVVHIEGLLIHGDDLSEGIQIDAEDAIVQLQNVRVMNLHARDQQNFTDNHPDVIQPYGGVGELRVDGLTGETDYQGLFLAEDLGPIGRVDLRRVNILSTDTARYLLWAGDYPLSVQDVYADPAPGRSWDMTLWGDADQWKDVKQGIPADGDFVKAGTVGTGYVSPGYTG